MPLSGSVLLGVIMAESVIRVLLVEDDEEDYILAMHMLSEARNLRFDVSWADRLESALNHMNSATVDVVLLDLSLPDSYGWDTFTSVRKHSPDLPIVLLTGVQDEDLGARAVYEGAQDYLVKDELSTQLLSRAISYAMERRRAQDALHTAYSELESLIRQRTRELAKANQKLSIEMARRERAERALKEGRRLEAICAFVDGTAHRFNDITHRIADSASKLRQASARHKTHAGICDNIVTETKSAHDTCSRLMGLAKAAGLVAIHLEPISVDALLKDVLGESSDHLRRAGIETSVDGNAPGVVASADKGQLSDIIVHCLQNAADIMPDGGYISLSIFERDIAVPPEDAAPDAEGGHYLIFEIKYAETSLDEERIDALLNPITGTGDQGTFSGLGLAVVENRARGWGGWLEIIMDPDGGGGFRIFMPVSKDALHGEDTPASALLHGRTVLVVDDDEVVLQAIRCYLEGAGYVVALADSPEAAIALVESVEHIGIAIVDAVMPGASGEDVLVHVRRAHPETVPVVISGFSKDYVQGVMTSADWRFLQKPLDKEMLVGAIDNIVRGHVSFSR